MTDLSPETVGKAKQGMDLCLVSGVLCLLCAIIAAFSGWVWWTLILAGMGAFNLGFCHAERIIRALERGEAR